MRTKHDSADHLRTTLPDPADASGGDERCPKCATPLAETGAPIWEIYCPNKACSHDMDRARLAIAQIRRQREDVLVANIVEEVGVSPETAQRIVRRLIDRGMVSWS